MANEKLRTGSVRSPIVRENKTKNDEGNNKICTQEHMHIFARTYISLISIFYKIYEYMTRDSSSSSVFCFDA